MSASSNAHPAEHPDREIEEDVLAVPFIAWLTAVGTILIVASVLALTGMYYQTQSRLDRERAEAAAALVTPAEAKVAADKTALNGYYRGVPDPNLKDGKYVSIPVSEGRKKVLEQYAK